MAIESDSSIATVRGHNHTVLPCDKSAMNMAEIKTCYPSKPIIRTSFCRRTMLFCGISCRPVNEQHGLRSVGRRQFSIKQESFHQLARDLDEQTCGSGCTSTSLSLATSLTCRLCRVSDSYCMTHLSKPCMFGVYSRHQVHPDTAASPGQSKRHIPRLLQHCQPRVDCPQGVKTRLSLGG